MKMKFLIPVILSVLTIAGCASTDEEYYKAVQKAAEANAEAHRAKMEALTAMAKSGDAAAAGAAVMAMALTETPTVQPQYIESSALKWASVLAAPVTTLGAVYLQTDLAKHQSDNMASVQVASLQSNENIQLGQQGMLIDALGVSGAGSQAAVDGLVTLGTAGFNALNTAGDQTVNLGTVGFNTVDSVAQTGFTTVDSVAQTGFTTVDSVAQTGFTTVGSVAQTGFTTVGSVADLGFSSTVDITEKGFDSTTLLGQAGIDGMENISAQYQQAIADMNALIDSITSTLAPVPTP
jgi:hypothetical protein